MTRTSPLRLAAIGVVLAGAAPVPPPVGKTLGSALETINALPAELADWRRGGVTDFAARPGGAALGASAEYRPATGGAGIATIYAYDRGVPPLREGVAAPEVAAELDGAVAEVQALAPYRGYTIVTRAPGPMVAGPFGEVGLRCEALVLAFSGGPQADALVCAGVRNGRFLKLRMTLPAGAGAQAVPFAQALLQVVR